MRLTNFIICDLIRQENTNKYLLIGVYDSNIKIFIPKEHTSSILIPSLSFFIRFKETEENEKLPESFKFVFSFNIDGQPINECANLIKGERGNGVTISLSFNPFVIPFNANKIDFKIYLNYSDGNSVEFQLDNLKVIINEQNASSPEIKVPV